MKTPKPTPPNDNTQLKPAKSKVIIKTKLTQPALLVPGLNYKPDSGKIIKKSIVTIKSGVRLY
jgi:hypothetical protein